MGALDRLEEMNIRYINDFSTLIDRYNHVKFQREALVVELSGVLSQQNLYKFLSCQTPFLKSKTFTPSTHTNNLTDRDLAQSY
jgi:hypothetical protein